MANKEDITEQRQPEIKIKVKGLPYPCPNCGAMNVICYGVKNCPHRAKRLH